MYYLYVKTHKVTGLKYLGWTTQSDPNKSTGAGVLWLAHIRTHGNTCTTEVIDQCSRRAELDRLIKLYVDKWGVDGSLQWANLVVGNQTNGRRMHNRDKVVKLNALHRRIIVPTSAPTTSEQLMQLLKQCKILTERGERLVVNPRWEIHAQIHKAAWRYFQDQYDWCDGGVKEQIYCVLNNINEPPGCIKCNKFVTFNIHTNRYNPYCSTGCVHSGCEKISAASATLI